jgi:hypothetical protein
MALSESHFFQVVRPTLSAGRERIDVRFKTTQQGRLIIVLERSTGTMILSAETGSDSNLTTRLNLVKF